MPATSMRVLSLLCRRPYFGALALACLLAGSPQQVLAKSPAPRAQDSRGSAESVSASPTLRPSGATGRRERADVDDSSATDCNHNGLADEEDILAGVEPDANRDGVVDNCLQDADLSLDWSRAHHQLGPTSLSERDRRFRVVYSEARRIRIVYAIAGDSSRVQVFVLKGPETRLQLRDQVQVAGAYEIDYTPKTGDGRVLKEGLEVIQANIGSQHFLQPIEWRWP